MFEKRSLDMPIAENEEVRARQRYSHLRSMQYSDEDPNWPIGVLVPDRANLDLNGRVARMRNHNCLADYPSPFVERSTTVFT